MQWLWGDWPLQELLQEGRKLPQEATACKEDAYHRIAEQEFYDKEGNRVTVSSQHMLSMKHSKPQQELLVQFGIGKDFHSIDKKVTLKLDTGADVNAFNRTTFRKLFPDMALQPSTVMLENFDKTMVKPMGTFKCFLHWKGKVYRIQVEVMDSEDTPNVLSRETTFLMGILKPCFVVKKVPEITDGTATMNCNSKAEMKNYKSIQGPQMSCSASTDTKKLVKTQFLQKMFNIFIQIV